MIDVHCHINFHKFEEDYDSSQEAIDLAEKYDELYAIVGVHPHHADKVELNREAEDSLSSRGNEATERSQEISLRQPADRNDKELWIKTLEEMTKHPKVVGIGECGLDYYSYQSNGIVDPKLQKEVFESQIELSHRAGLPLQIHNRQAGEDVIDILKHHKILLLSVPGMFHCFAGSETVLKDALDLGFFIGFDGNITYKGIAKGETTDLKDIAKMVPLDRIVLETDSPYLTPHPYRGQRNEPAYGILVAEFIADLKGISYEALVEQTDKNVYTMFKKLK
jgi:TatD DNase family protein